MDTARGSFLASNSEVNSGEDLFEGIGSLLCQFLSIMSSYHVIKYCVFASGCSFWLKAIRIDQIYLFTRVNYLEQQRFLARRICY